VHGGGSHGLCYAAVFASRTLHGIHAGVASKGKWTGLISRSSENVRFAPLRWKRPLLIFLSSRSDFWHENVPLEWLAEALDVMDRTPWHTYLILTKRPGNINRKLAQLKRKRPRNAWIGVSIGHEKSLRLLKPLLQVEVSLRFLSCEPLLMALPNLSLAGIGWVIGGGQSGSNAALCKAEWIRDLRDLCLATSTPFFLKQWGSMQTWESVPPPSRTAELDWHVIPETAIHAERDENDKSDPCRYWPRRCVARRGFPDRSHRHSDFIQRSLCVRALPA
jgi:protein gp37